MANEKIICEKQDLVAIADAVRAKNGTTASMTLGQISTSIAGISGGENLDAVLAEQAALITELETALEGKASGGASVETCTVTINEIGGSIDSIAYTTIENGQTISKYVDSPNQNISIACVRGTLLFLESAGTTGQLTGATLIYRSAGVKFIHIDSTYTGNVVISYSSGNSGFDPL